MMVVQEMYSLGNIQGNACTPAEGSQTVNEALAPKLSTYNMEKQAVPQAKCVTGQAEKMLLGL